MKKVTLPGTDISCSRFIFGTAGLFNVGSAKARRDLLEAAVEAGFSHFDTAPYYGFGWAERDLAPILRADPTITVTTKVGIYSPGGENNPAPVVFAIKAAGRAIKALSTPTVDFSVNRAQHSLDASLKRLQRDRVELYMLHEAEMHMLDTDEWLRWLEKCKADGKIAEFGIAVTSERAAPFLSAGSPLAKVVQMTDSLNGREADICDANGREKQITYGYISAAKKANPAANVREILAEALRRNSTGAIIVSTGKTARLRQYQEILEASE